MANTPAYYRAKSTAINALGVWDTVVLPYRRTPCFTRIFDLTKWETLREYSTQVNDTEDNDTQHNDIQHSNK